MLGRNLEKNERNKEINLNQNPDIISLVANNVSAAKKEH